MIIFSYYIIYLILVTTIVNGSLRPPLFNEISRMALAVRHFEEKFFLKFTTSLTITVNTDSSSSSQNRMAKYYFNDLLYEILEAMDELKMRLETNNIGYDIKEFDYFNIIMIDSFQSFRKINPGINSKNEDFSEFYLIVLHRNPFKSSEDILRDMQRIFDYCWKYYITNVNILMESTQRNTTSIDLYTYYPFSENHCNKAVLRILNAAKSINNLSTVELFPRKFNNLYNCNLMAALWDVPPYVMLPRSGKVKNNNNNGEPLHLDGFEGDLMHVIAEVMNFSIQFITPQHDEQRGLIMTNGTTTGAVKLLQQKRADLSLGCFRCTLERSTTLSPSITYYQTMQVFTVLATREPWTSYEILAYPFDFYVWTILFSLMLILISSAILLQYLKVGVLTYLYGFSHYGFVILNWSATAIGQPAYPEPRRNFARFILISWLMLTLVLRSSYQGLLFDLLHSQKTIAPPNTMEQLSKRDYKLILNVATNDSFSGVPIIRDKQIKVLVMNITDDGGYPILEKNPNERYVTGTPRDFLTYYVNNNGKYGVFHVLKETIFAQHICIYFTKHSFLMDTFNWILLYLSNFGLIDHWASKYLDETFLELSGVGDENQSLNVPLSFSQLYGIFLIQAVLWSLSIIIFIVELISQRIMN